MKYALYAGMVVLAFILGKVLYSPLRPSLVGEAEAEVVDEGPQMVHEVKVRLPNGNITEKVDLAAVDVGSFPKEVILAVSAELADESGETSLTLDSGTPVRPVSLTDGVLVVTSDLAPQLKAQVHAIDTDFVVKVARIQAEQRLAKLNPGGTPAQPVVAAADPVVAPIPPTPEPAPKVAMNDSQPATGGVDPALAAPSATSEQMSDPEPVEPVEVAEGPLDDDAVVALMKEHLASGAITEIPIDKIFKWESLGEETFDGENYQVGLATYKERTILGESTLSAKALIKGGEVEKWVFATTGMQIR